MYGNLKASELTYHPDIDGQIRALREGDLSGLVSRLGNVLETVTIPVYPVIGEIKAEMRRLGAAGALMSGSGPAVFGLFEDPQEARLAYAAMKEGGLADQVYLTGFFHV